MSDSSVRSVALAARSASRALTALTDQQRQHILQSIEQAIKEKQDIILAANQEDVKRAESDASLTSASKARLLLTQKKLDVLRDGIIQIANGPDPIGRLLRHTQLADGLELKQVSVPIGVLLIIFESRPDVLPQIAALAVRSGNGLILKGGHESSSSIACLHSIITSAITTATSGTINGTHLIGLVHSRSEIAELLKLEDVIDLIIPRGSGTLVKYIQQNTKIPVMGHAEGICHLYIDAHASLEKAIRLIIDSKCDYPAACNAMETLLIHQKWIGDDVKQSGAGIMVSALLAAGVTVYAGPHATSLATTFSLPTTTDLHHEYGELACTVEIVDDINIAIDHIHTYGSSHTESIVTEDRDVAQQFLTRVDAACVFHNTSTRFADGYRMGLGAEVGISTGRLHARGPVGVEGLTSTKWIIVSEDSHTAAQFAKGESTFIHKTLPIQK